MTEASELLKGKKGILILQVALSPYENDCDQ